MVLHRRSRFGLGFVEKTQNAQKSRRNGSRAASEGGGPSCEREGGCELLVPARDAAVVDLEEVLHLGHRHALFEGPKRQKLHLCAVGLVYHAGEGFGNHYVVVGGREVFILFFYIILIL